eukprot:g2964.t1
MDVLEQRASRPTFIHGLNYLAVQSNRSRPIRVTEAWQPTRRAARFKINLLQIRGCAILLIALSIGSFASMMADGTLVNTHLSAARCVNVQFQQENPFDCNGMVVSFPTVVLISTILCFATLASLLWIALHLVDSGHASRGIHDISTMLVIFNVIKVTFVCLHGMFIAMTWESNLTERWREGVGCLLGQFEAGFVMLSVDLTQILITFWIWIKVLQLHKLCKEDDLNLTKLRLQRLPERRFGDLDAEERPEHCIICLTDFEESSQVSRLACGHLFHASCIKEWLGGKKSASCPYRCHGSPLEGVAVPMASTVSDWPFSAEPRSVQEHHLLLLQRTVAEAQSIGADHGFEDLMELLKVVEELRSRPDASGNEVKNEVLKNCSELLQSWLCDAGDAESKPGKLLELLQTISMSSELRTSPRLLSSILKKLLSKSQVLGGPGLASALQALGRLRVLNRREGESTEEEEIPRLSRDLRKEDGERDGEWCMPKLGRSPSRPGRPSTGPSWPKRPAGSAHGRTQKDGSGAGLQKTGSFSRLQKSDSFAHVPQAVRLEFYRYSTPLKGPMGRMNVHQVSKNFKFYGYAQIFEAMMFITRAPTDKDFMSQLDEGQKATVGDALGKTLQNLASSEEERQLIQELTRKMKGHGSEFLKNPEEFSAKATQLVMELLEGSPEEKEAAKKEISEMPETAPALSADEEATAIQKLKDMEKEFEENRGDIEHALDEEATAIQKLKDMEKEFEEHYGDIEQALDEVDQGIHGNDGFGTCMSRTFMLKAFTSILRFISHYWGEHLEKFLEGVRQHLAVRGLSGRTGYWLGAFATRHTDFTDTGTFSPHVWSKVAEAAHFRLLLVLNSTDLKNPAPALARSWYCPGVGLHLKQRREVSFPVEVAEARARERLCEWAWAVKHWWSEITDPAARLTRTARGSTGARKGELGVELMDSVVRGWKEELLEGSLRLDFAILILLLLGTLFTTLAQKRESVLGSVCLCLGVMESFQMLAITVSPGDENHHLVIAFVVLCHSNVHPVALLIVVIYCITFAWRWTDMIEEISRRFSDESLKKILHYMDDKDARVLQKPPESDNEDPSSSPVLRRQGRLFCWAAAINSWVWWLWLIWSKRKMLEERSESAESFFNP